MSAALLKAAAVRIAYLRDLRRVLESWFSGLPIEDHNARTEAAQALIRVEAELVWVEAKRDAEAARRGLAREGGPPVESRGAR